MKYKIIPEKCIACGLCQIYAPTVFDYTEEGIVLFKNKPNQLYLDVSDKERSTLDAVTKAYRKCPVRAIEIEKEAQNFSV